MLARFVNEPARTEQKPAREFERANICSVRAGSLTNRAEMLVQLVTKLKRAKPSWSRAEQANELALLRRKHSW